MAHAESLAEYYKIPDMNKVVPEVNMESDIVRNKYGGFGIHYTAGSLTMIKELKVEWK